MNLSRLTALFHLQPLPLEKRLSKEASLSLLMHGFYVFGSSMSMVFLNLYLWRLTESLWLNGIYNAIVFFMVVVAFAAGGWLSKKKGIMLTYRSGIALLSLFFLIVIIARENIVSFAFLFALFHGFASGLYWVGYITLMYDVSTPQNRIRYLALNFIIFNSASLIGPALGGIFIIQNEGLSGYIIVFFCSFAFFFLTTLYSFKFKLKASHHKSYYLNMMGLVMKKNIPWFKGLIGWFIQGLKQGIVLFLPPILLYYVLAREDYVGYMGVLLSVLGIGTGYFLSRYANEGMSRAYILSANVIFLVGSLFLFWEISFWTVIAFLIGHSISAPIQNNVFSAHHFHLISKLPLKGNIRIEAIVMRELFLNCGRVLSIIFFVYVVHDLEHVLFPIMVLILACSQFLLAALIDKRD